MRTGHEDQRPEIRTEREPAKLEAVKTPSSCSNGLKCLWSKCNCFCLSFCMMDDCARTRRMLANSPISQSNLSDENANRVNKTILFYDMFQPVKIHSITSKPCHAVNTHYYDTLLSDKSINIARLTMSPL